MKYLVVIKSDWQTVARLDVEADDPSSAIHRTLEKEELTERGVAYAIPMKKLGPEFKVLAQIDFVVRP